MNKAILLISICAILVSGNGLNIDKGGVITQKETALKVDKGDVITQKETALKIGKALLEEHFPDAFSGSEILLDAEEKSGIWRVHNVIERIGKTKEGKFTVAKGGEIYVEFRKSNGEVINLGLDD